MKAGSGRQTATDGVSQQRVARNGTRLRVLVAEARVPFVRDGADLHAETLVIQLRRHGHDAESVALPFRAQKSTVLDQACAWRMLNLSASNARPVDVLIATRF